jgi:glycosyltransferase involved in cell wall biosynthesis
MEPIVSIIIPAHNREKRVGRAIESVLKQTYKYFELIIINDCSNDKTLEIISRFSKRDLRIKVITNESNLGLAKSLNKAIKISRGRYIARLDDDDSWSDPGKLEKQVTFLEKKLDYVLVGGGVIRIDEQDKEVMRFYLPKEDEDIRRAILLKNPFAHSAVVFRKETWEKSGGYDETLVFSEDWDLWMRFGKLGKFYNFPEYFIYYLQSEKSMSNLNVRRNIKINTELIKKYCSDYVGCKKSIFFCRLAYLYSFLPFNRKLWPIVFKIKNRLWK